LIEIQHLAFETRRKRASNGAFTGTHEAGYNDLAHT
jgi:hypothetical protein